MEISYIYGKHAVTEALRKRPDCVYKLHATPDQTELLKSQFGSNLPAIEPLNPARLPGRLHKDVVHQGIIAECAVRKLLTPYEDWREGLDMNRRLCVAILGELQDPHNVGAVIRSAAAFGLDAVLLPKHRQPTLTGTVIKVSAGTVFSLPIIEIGNVNRTIKELQKIGFWVYGLDMETESALPEEPFIKPTAFVIGNEGAGLRQKTKEACDQILHIPMSSSTESLNASVSAGVAFYAWQASAKMTDSEASENLL